MSESPGKTRSAEQFFLDYCHLVVDSFAVLSKGDGGSNEKFSILKKRADDFLSSIGCNGGVNPYNQIDELKEFIAQLFASAEIVKWLYDDQLKILHSNITVEKKKKNDEKHEFIHPFLPPEGDAWYTTPRLPICMGWEDCGSNGKLKFPENDLPSLSYSLLDKHFLPAYLYILTAFDGLLDKSVDKKQELRERLAECKITTDNDKIEDASKKLLAPFLSYWQSKKDMQNILQKIVLDHQPEFKNKYPPVDLESLDKLLPEQHKRRIFFEVQVAFDRWLSTIGIPKDWIFKYELKKDIEKKTGCMFCEEGENLWEVLKYSILLLDNKNDKEEKRKILDKLFVLFWIKTEKSREVSITERGNNLLAWWRREKNTEDCESDFSAMEKQLLTEINGTTYEKLLKESSINIPVNAFFLAMPPPTGVYRCEITYGAYENTDNESSVEKIWVLAAINFPGILKDDCTDELVDIICKQKVLMGLLVDPLLRGYLKEDMEKHIKAKAKQDAEIALRKKHEEMLNLLTKPLESLTDALNRTQEDTQRLRAILYNPTKSLFAAAPLVRDYFTEGHHLHLGSVSWEVSHEPDTYENPFAACAILAAVVRAIFGKVKTFSQAGDGDELWRSTLELLNQSQSDLAFEQLTKTVNLLLWYHKGTNGNGEDKEKTLLNYMKNVLVDNITAQPDKNTPDNINFNCIKGSLNRFKKVMFTPFKEGEPVHPLLPLALIFYEGLGVKPTITITVQKPVLEYTYGNLEDILIRSETIRPFQDIGACLPVPRYAMLLSFLGGIIDYAVRPPDRATFSQARIKIVPEQECVVEMTFSIDVFKDMESTFSAMARAVGTTGLRFTGNFLKPFVDFASLCSGIVQKSSDNGFSIQCPIEKPQFACSIKAQDDSFCFELRRSGERE